MTSFLAEDEENRNARLLSSKLIRLGTMVSQFKKLKLPLIIKMTCGEIAVAMSTSHLILESISNNRGRRRRRQQDRQKSRSEKPKTLHVQNAFLYISLPSIHDYGVKLRGRELFTWHRNDFHSRASSCHLHIFLCICSYDTEKKFCSRTGHSGMSSFRFSFWIETHSGIVQTAPKFLWRTCTQDYDFLFLCINIDTVLSNSTPEKCANI